MKRIHLFSAAIMGLLACSCNTEEFEPQAQVREVTISATMENDAETRSTIGEGGAFIWAANDQIGIHTGSEFTPFTLVGEGGSSQADFKATLVEGQTPTGYAVYPHHAKHVYENRITKVHYPAVYGSTDTPHALNTNAVMVSNVAEVAEGGA